VQVTGEANPIKVPQNAEDSSAARDALAKVWSSHALPLYPDTRFPPLFMLFAPGAFRAIGFGVTSLVSWDWRVRSVRGLMWYGLVSVVDCPEALAVSVPNGTHDVP
jgi:hypothetical protein